MTKHPTSIARQAAYDLLQAGADRIHDDPMTNSVFGFALGEFTKLITSKSGLSDIEALIDEVHVVLAVERAEALRAQHDLDRMQGDEKVKGSESLKDRLENLALQGWETYKKTVETNTGGFVFTAHPTFALPDTLRAALVAYARAPTAETLTALSAATKTDAQAWCNSISLLGEHQEAQRAIANAQRAMQVYLQTVYDIARQRFPEEWRQLRPIAPSLASWVGYDLDGRTDIEWWQSVALRLEEKATQLDRYATRLEALNTLPSLVEKLNKAARCSAEEAELFKADLNQPDAMIAAATRLSAPHPDRVVDAQTIRSVVLEAANTSEDALASALYTLAAEIAVLQLGTARIHLRVNAAQVRSVIMRDLGLATEDSVLGRLALQELAERTKNVEPKTSNFADLFLEKSTAQRQILMCAIWLKYIDSGSPIRFLIAEAENPATVMGVLYLAKKHGISEMLDISPLFETPEALESGGRFIARLLEEPVYLDYIRARGQLAVQFGFSDAGRFIGQLAADMAIERIHNLIAKALYDTAPDVNLLLFNTHGESMGRGGYPGSFVDRFEHCLSCWNHSNARARGQHLIHEVSFQGGDGFMHFASEALAHSTYQSWCHYNFGVMDDCREDPFYLETDFTWDVYRWLRRWHVNLFSDPDYGFLLNNFATNFLVRAGSRRRRRAGNAAGPRALRAISHNATLQQLGVPVNTAAGLGSAIRHETERMITLLNRSSRMRHLTRLALIARQRTSLPVLRGYAQVYNPATWVAIDRHIEAESEHASQRVYRTLKCGDIYASLSRMANHFAFDLRRLDRILASLDNAPSVTDRYDGRLNIHVLHGLRQALMMYAMALVGKIPSLSSRHDASRDDIMILVVEMRLEEAQKVLAEIFPASSVDLEKLSAISGEDSIKMNTGYDKLNAEIIRPLGDIQRLMYKVTLALSHAYKAYG